MTLSLTKKLLTPSLSGILNFDRNAFIANLGQLFSDGIQCGKNYAEFSGTDISAYEQYLGMTRNFDFLLNLKLRLFLISLRRSRKIFQNH